MTPDRPRGREPRDIDQRRLKVVRVIARLNVGGPARHVVILNDGLRARGYDTLLAHGDVSEGEASFEALIAARQIKLFRVPGLGRSVRLAGDLWALSHLVRLLLRERPDVVHTHTAKAGALGRIAALLFNATRRRATRCAVVHTFHGHVLSGYFWPPVSTVVQAIERGLAHVTDRIVAISPLQACDLGSRLGAAAAKKIVVVPLGLDLDRLLALDVGRKASARQAFGLAPDDIVFAYLGRLVPIKNLVMLLGAFPAVVARSPRARLLIGGDGPLRSALERLAHDLGIEPVTRFTGWLPDPTAFHAASDVAVISSINEGTPVSLIEAMAAGCPAVATRVGGVPDVVEDEETGLLVAPQRPADLAAAMLRLADDPDRRILMGRKARETARRYLSDRLVVEMAALYQEVVAEKRGEAVTARRAE